MLTSPPGPLCGGYAGQKARAQPVRINLIFSGVRKDPVGYRWSPARESVEWPADGDSPLGLENNLR